MKAKSRVILLLIPALAVLFVGLLKFSFFLGELSQSQHALAVKVERLEGKIEQLEESIRELKESLNARLVDERMPREVRDNPGADWGTLTPPTPPPLIEP